MKLNLKFKAFLGVAVVLVLAACASTTLEQQIAVKEPGAWDFTSKRHVDVNGEPKRIVRIYDREDKVGFLIIEHGQKHPCNLTFQKAIKTTAPGVVAYERDPDFKSFSCDSGMKYVFRINEQGQPYEGWEMKEILDREKKPYPNVADPTGYWNLKRTLPMYTLVK